MGDGDEWDIEVEKTRSASSWDYTGGYRAKAYPAFVRVRAGWCDGYGGHAPLELTPDEARKMARELAAAADKADDFSGEG